MSKIIDTSLIDDWMRKCALRFLESVSFNETYLRETDKYQKNKKQIDFSNILKELRNNTKSKQK